MRGKAEAIVPIQVGGRRPPLYFVHAHGGSVVGYVELALRLGADQPFFGIQGQQLDQPQVPGDVTIGDLAAGYVDQVRRHQSAGPIHLGGWCLGGVIAYEMARQLAAAGDPVASVIMVQAHLADYPKIRRGLGWARPALSAVDRLDQELGAFRDVPTGERRSHLGDRWHAGSSSLVGRRGVRSRRTAKGGLNTKRSMLVRSDLEDGYTAGFESYRPAPYAGLVALLRAERQPRGAQHDPTLGWRPYLRGPVITGAIPGPQLRMLDEPRVALVADAIAELLSAPL